MIKLLEENNLTYEEYLSIAASVDWKCPSKRLLQKSLENSFTVKYVISNKPVGMARLITDQGYFAFLADVVVRPEYQNQGIGTLMIENLIKRLKDTLEDGEEVMFQLLAAKGKSPFYEKFGFKIKDTIDAGMYMWMKK